MRNNIKAYKVVTRNLKSAHWPRAVAYTPDGNLIKPHKGANQFLFIFDSITNARRFVGIGVDYYHIWEVKANNVRTFSKTINGKDLCVLNSGYPKGTMLCSSLRMIRRVEVPLNY